MKEKSIFINSGRILGITPSKLTKMGGKMGEKTRKNSKKEREKKKKVKEKENKVSKRCHFEKRELTIIKF